jgi:hypothetical protein
LGLVRVFFAGATDLFVRVAEQRPGNATAGASFAGGAAGLNNAGGTPSISTGSGGASLGARPIT